MHHGSLQFIRNVLDDLIQVRAMPFYRKWFMTGGSGFHQDTLVLTFLVSIQIRQVDFDTRDPLGNMLQSRLQNNMRVLSNGWAVFNTPCVHLNLH